MNITQLIRDSKDGHHASQKYLFDIFAPKLLNVCRRFLKNDQDAEERLMDGFTSFFRTLNSFSYQGDQAMYVFLKRIMINECLMFLREKRSLMLVEESAAEDIPMPVHDLMNLPDKRVLAILDQLPVGYKTVFNLYVFEGLSHDQIAELLGISAGCSRSQLTKAKKILTKILTAKGGLYEHRK